MRSFCPLVVSMPFEVTGEITKILLCSIVCDVRVDGLIETHLEMMKLDDHKMKCYSL